MDIFSTLISCGLMSPVLPSCTSGLDGMIRNHHQSYVPTGQEIAILGPVECEQIRSLVLLAAETSYYFIILSFLHHLKFQHILFQCL